MKIVQQGFRNGNLALICECVGCGAKYNLGTIEDARPVIDACRARAEEEEREHKGSGAWWEEVAYRIESGYAEVGKAAVS